MDRLVELDRMIDRCFKAYEKALAERDQARTALTKIAAFASNRPPGQPWETYKRLALEGWPEALSAPVGEDHGHPD